MQAAGPEVTHAYGRFVEAVQTSSQAQAPSLGRIDQPQSSSFTCCSQHVEERGARAERDVVR